MNKVLKSLCDRCSMSMSSTWIACSHRLNNKYCYEVEIIDEWLDELEKYKEKYEERLENE